MTQRGERLPELVAIMRRLLGPDGCPWDREQSLESLRPYVIEEAHEVVDAIDRKDMKDLREELGDLLLQVVFQSELAAEHFGIDDVIGAICEKMVRRHPHVFGAEQAADAGAVKGRWEEIKAAEKRDREAREGAPVRGVLDGVPTAMPALLRGARMAEKAAHLGLDWPDLEGPRAKLREELAELDAALAAAAGEVLVAEARGPAREQNRDGSARRAIEGELGDVLFALVNLARKLEIDPEAALRGTLERFGERVRFVEREGRARGIDLAELPFEELDRLWNEAKEVLRGAQE
jgi:MazG family protein